jgi:UrcA family protein
MKTIFIGVGATVGAFALISSLAFGQNLEEIKIEATRNMDVKADTFNPPGGFRVEDISLSYAVSTAGLNLASPADVTQLEKRVRDAALTACKEIGKQYPDSMPNDADCAKAASDKAMAKVTELAAAARKKSAK